MTPERAWTTLHTQREAHETLRHFYAERYLPHMRKVVQEVLHRSLSDEELGVVLATARFDPVMGTITYSVNSHDPGLSVVTTSITYVVPRVVSTPPDTTEMPVISKKSSE